MISCKRMIYLNVYLSLTLDATSARPPLKHQLTQMTLQIRADKKRVLQYLVDKGVDYSCIERHYENTPIQIYRKFHLQKLKNFQIKNSDIFHISAQNIDCGCSLEPPWRGGSNEYLQSMFLSRNKKNNVYPCKP